jgi:hypothetical protein
VSWIPKLIAERNTVTEDVKALEVYFGDKAALILVHTKSLRQKCGETTGNVPG